MRCILLIFTSFLLLGLSASEAQDNPVLTAEQRANAVNGVARQVEENFYDSSIGSGIADQMRADLANGNYDTDRTAADLAQSLTEFLRPHDTHFNVQYTGSPAASGSGGPRSPGSRQAFLDQARRSNYGFNAVSILPGNVGYIDMRQFAPVQLGGDTALAALSFVENTDAVIFDMRQNRGGAPSMVQLLISHFLDPANQVPINTFMASNRDYPAEMMSLAYLPGEARPNVPLYVLTSSRTGSAGEAFPYHLQAMGRATIIGETTYGAGNPGGMLPAGEGFSVFVSSSRTRNPITGTNWEGTGVTPDIDVPAEAALDQALVMAYQAILETAEDPCDRQSVEWALEAVNASLNPATLDAATARALSGSYGERTIEYSESGLTLRRGTQTPRRLIPLSNDRFMIEGLDGVRLSIQREGDQVVSLTVHQSGRPPSISMRD